MVILDLGGYDDSWRHIDARSRRGGSGGDGGGEDSVRLFRLGLTLVGTQGDCECDTFLKLKVGHTLVLF